MTNRWIQNVYERYEMSRVQMTCQLDFCVATVAENMNTISEMKGQGLYSRTNLSQKLKLNLKDLELALMSHND